MTGRIADWACDLSTSKSDSLSVVSSLLVEDSESLESLSSDNGVGT